MNSFKSVLFCVAFWTFSLLHSGCFANDNYDVEWVNDTLMVDVGHCPGEGCMYGSWWSREKITVYESPYNFEVTGYIEPNDTFTALTGNVYFVPAVFIAVEDCEGCVYNQKGFIPIQAGDTIMALTNIGEGHYNVRIRNEYAISDYWGNDNFEDWWVKVKTREGLTGWIRFYDYRIFGSDAFA